MFRRGLTALLFLMAVGFGVGGAASLLCFELKAFLVCLALGVVSAAQAYLVVTLGDILDLVYRMREENEERYYRNYRPGDHRRDPED